MNRVSVALAASFSAALSLLGLDTSGPITFAVSKAETTGDTFTLWGSLDSTAVGSDNVQNLGSFSGLDGTIELPPNIAEQARTWPYLLVQRTGGSSAGTFYATGNASPASTIVSAAASVVANGYSAVLDLTALSAVGVRIGTSKAMTSSDVFDVFVTEDSTVTSSTGCYYAGRIVGGGGTSQISVLTKGWPYAIVQRVSGTTAGNVLAAGVTPATDSSPAWIVGGQVVGAAGIIGPSDNQTFAVQTNGITRMTVLGGASSSGFVGIGNPTPAARFDVVEPTVAAAPTVANFNGFGTQRTVYNFRNSDATSAGISLFMINPNTGVGWSVNSDPAFSGAQTFTIRDESAGVVRAQIDATGNTLTSPANGNNALTTSGTGANILTGGSGTNTWSVLNGGTITIGGGAVNQTCNFGTGAGVVTTTIGSGTSTSATSVNCGTGTCNLGANATAHATNVGSTTGGSATALRAGTGGLTIVNNGVTWTWPTALGAAGSKLTDAAGNGTLSFA